MESLQSVPELKHYVDELEAARNRGGDAAINQGKRGSANLTLQRHDRAARDVCDQGRTWYQGESNTSAAVEYRSLLPALIEGWRKQWGEDMPFLVVQLPGFGRRVKEPGPSDWAMLREAQAQTLKLPNTGMAVTIDLSTPRQVLHPKNKVNVGKRLALVRGK